MKRDCLILTPGEIYGALLRKILKYSSSGKPAKLMYELSYPGISRYKEGLPMINISKNQNVFFDE